MAEPRALPARALAIDMNSTEDLMMATALAATDCVEAMLVADARRVPPQLSEHAREVVKARRKAKG